jgi:hypothetical protein
MRSNTSPRHYAPSDHNATATGFLLADEYVVHTCNLPSYSQAHLASGYATFLRTWWRGSTLSVWFLVDRNASDFGTCLNRRFCNAKLHTFLARANAESILLRPVPFLARLVISFATSEDRLQDAEHHPRMAGKREG